MVRRAIAVTAGLLLLSVVAMGAAWAQTSPVITVTTTTTTTSTTTSTTSTSVLPDEETTTTTTEAETTTTTAAPATTAEVAGDVVVRPLPRTGSDLGGPAVVGAALTITGIALALGARRRRNSFENA